MLEDPSEMDPLVQEIMADYDTSREFFSEHQLPEYAVLDDLELQDRELALFLTLTCVTNHIHDGTGESKKTDGSDGLWRVCEELWEQHRWTFLPEELVGDSRKAELTEIFSRLEIMDERDPDWWFRTAKTLHFEWDDDPLKLLADPGVTPLGVDDASYDAPSIERAVSANDFPALGGSKILPLWLRLMHEEVHDLRRIQEIDIPVDFHIVGMTNRLRPDSGEFDRFNDEDKKMVRRYWHLVCERNDLAPVQVDKPLWLLNKYWEQGGRVYIAQILRQIRTE